MRAIMVMYDSLNKHFLQPYGCDWTSTPNFTRLAEKTVRFENSYVGSLPCMPARRELHTGRMNFLHRSWGPVEPFDDSMPEILKNNGIYSHLVSDHSHYWEDGGATYHPRYSSWEASRGQEGDPWKGVVNGDFASETAFNSSLLAIPEFKNMKRQDQVNRSFLTTEEEFPQTVTFTKGLEFLAENVSAQNWFVQIETFDPHEPFFTTDEYKALYGVQNTGEAYDWPPYGTVLEDPATVDTVRKTYAALLSMCDKNLGKVLDFMDAHNMWEDTMLIVNTDHGYLLGEHDWWSKTVMPVYNEIANTPLFIWDPREKVKGVSRNSLVQTIDLAPTLLEFFSLPIPPDMQGLPLRGVVRDDTPVRDYAVFGYHGAHINITDGEHLYMRGPASPTNSPLFDYTLLPTHMRSMFSVKELKNAQLSPGFTFTKGCPVLKIPAVNTSMNPFQYGNKLFNLKSDPAQQTELHNPLVEQQLIAKLQEFMKLNDAPEEQYERLGIPVEGLISLETLEQQAAVATCFYTPDLLQQLQWQEGAYTQLKGILSLLPQEMRAPAAAQFEKMVTDSGAPLVTQQHVAAFAKAVIPPASQNMVQYLLSLWCRSR